MLSTEEGFDIEALSDITGISMSKMDCEDLESQHSGSIASDNTELLLNQNLSLRELDGDDSFLDSASQVGEQEKCVPKHQSFLSGSPKQILSSSDQSFTDSHPLQHGMSNGFSSHATFTQNGNSFSQELGMQKKSTMAPQQINGEGSTFMGLKQDIKPSPKLNDFGQLTGTRQLARKFPSDTDIAGGGRDSVIKHHSSMPIILRNENNSEIHDGFSREVVEKLRYGSHQKHSRGQELQFQQGFFVKDAFQNGSLMRGKHSGPTSGESLNEVHSFQTKSFNQEPFSDSHNCNSMDPNDRTSVFVMAEFGNDNNGAEQYNSLECHEELFSEPHTKTSTNQQDHSFRDTLKDFSIENDGQQMLLGVRHDPDTNELYDDKVREGADLLSRILGGDHNGSFTSFSSSSKSSERDEKTKSTPLHSSGPETIKKRSLNSSTNNEPRFQSSSSPRQSVENLPTSVSVVYTRESRLGARVHKTPDSVQQASVHGSENIVQHWASDQSMLVKGQASHGNTVVLRSEEENQEHHFINSGYDLRPEDKFTRDGKLVPQRRNPLNNENEDIDLGETLRDKYEKLKKLELDIDEMHSQKKMVMHELQVLEESLNRNKVDMSSSQNLVEQYRWQATQTRSELLELEKTRNQLQDECTSLNEVLKKSKRNETFNSDEIMFGRSKEEIFTSLQERDKFKTEYELAQEALKRERSRGKLAQDDLREKIRTLEDDLRKQHEETVDNLRQMKELDRERQKVRTLQHEKLDAINNLHDEMKELREKEIEALKAQMMRERASNVELLEEKFKREANQLRKAAENAEVRIRQLEGSLIEQNEEISKLRHQTREEKQKNINLEKHWRAQLESERQNAEIQMDVKERSCRDREDKLLRQQRNLESLLEERATDLRRAEERCRTQTEELRKIIENKSEEIKLVRGLVRQQEDATRVLGERLRTEAREHVRNAVEKERQNLVKEKERIYKSLDEEKERNKKIVKQLTEQLEMEKESHLQTKQILTKLKLDGEELRKQIVEIHGERITSVHRARQEGCEELEKIKEKLNEFTIQADKLERIDQETAKAIYDECRKIAEFVDMPVRFSTPSRGSDENCGQSQDSPTKEALASLRQCNNELRQRLADMKKQVDKQRTDAEQMKKIVPSSNSSEDSRNFHELLGEKEEEIRRLHKKYSDDMMRLQAEQKKEQMAYKRTIAKLEQEFQKLMSANVSGSSVLRANHRSVISRSSQPSSLKLTQTNYPQTPTINTSSRSTEKSSSTDLLKHLQERVKKLRAENENLKKTSEKETSANSAKLARRMKGMNSVPEIKAHQTSDMTDQNIAQVARLQKLLASRTKEDSR